MKQQNANFKKMALKVRIRRIIFTIMLIMLFTPILMAVGYKVTQSMSAKQSNKLFQEMTIINEVSSPNIEVSDQFIDHSDFMGGEVVSHRYKDIEGQRIPWSPLQGNYSWNQSEFNFSTFSSIDSEGAATYDRITQRKIPQFYSLDSHNLPEDATKLAKLKGAVSEVGVTFTSSMSYRKIKKIMPKGVHVKWYWLGSDKSKTEIDVEAMQLGFSEAGNGESASGNFAEYRHGIKELSASNERMKRYSKVSSDLNKVKIKGVIVTGDSQMMGKLVNKSWILATSAGVTLSKNGLN
ncbi:sigma factor regulator N-terminal domain-containing protein [Lentilactobacillus sp. Marseille-Q4993]|uniref:sigma factor regulator N-terminal domain-containing protein n=1 Tax=Lentilactobacillus sp. Marseille-Q4993 TaxID=3039492 RepID=UPI0024BCAA96|nr:sigma factor regulator N-terminal domain-containing protein [Lentilactobacillus sp. Marseille-Q4993]